MKTLSEQARITASMIALGEHIAYGRDVELLTQLADQVDALIVERDALFLKVDQWRVDFHELSLERDALMSAAKLALEALNAFAEWEDMGDPQRPATEAIAALRHAGVQ